MIKRIITLIKTDFSIDLKNLNDIAGVVLFNLTIVFVIYKSFNHITPIIWNVLFWIVILFSLSNAILKSFRNELGSSAIYYYTLASPTEIIIAKYIYNFVFSLIISIVCFFIFSLLMPVVFVRFDIFCLYCFLSLIGLSAIFTFGSAIASFLPSSAISMTILTFPLTLPILLLAIKGGASSLGLVNDSLLMEDVVLFCAIDLLLLGLLILLFPTIWKI